jgi:large subunit ribosomal protein L3
MPRSNQPRAGSLQFWPRKRIEKFLPSVNWRVLEERNKVPGLLGFIGYKVGMSTVIVKDKTPDSLTKDKKIPIPATIIELPSMKILSLRFYKNGQVKEEVLAENLDKELKRLIRLPKAKERKKIEEVKDYNDVRVVVYSLAKQTGVKKTPDIIEVGLAGKLEDKIKFAKENMNKEISASGVFKLLQLVDLRGLTKGKGHVGPIKRFGISKKSHKSQKGVRNPGSLGPWHPNVVTFRVAMAGQLGMFTRVQYNNKVIALGKIKEKNINPSSGWKNYGSILSEYAIVSGSVQGPAKRQLLLTFPLRKTKKQEKKNYEFVKVM